jgi:hypothetical protein
MCVYIYIYREREREREKEREKEREREAIRSSGFPSRRPGFEPRTGHVGFLLDKAALGQDFS